MGIWRPVYLEFWDEVKIEDIYVKPVHLSEDSANLNVEISLNNLIQNDYFLDVFKKGLKGEKDFETRK